MEQQHGKAAEVEPLRPSVSSGINPPTLRYPTLRYPMLPYATLPHPTPTPPQPPWPTLPHPADVCTVRLPSSGRSLLMVRPARNGKSPASSPPLSKSAHCIPVWPHSTAMPQTCRVLCSVERSRFMRLDVGTYCGYLQVCIRYQLHAPSFRPGGPQPRPSLRARKQAGSYIAKVSIRQPVFHERVGNFARTHAEFSGWLCL